VCCCLLSLLAAYILVLQPLRAPAYVRQPLQHCLVAFSQPVLAAVRVTFATMCIRSATRDRTLTQEIENDARRTERSMESSQLKGSLRNILQVIDRSLLLRVCVWHVPLACPQPMSGHGVHPRLELPNPHSAVCTLLVRGSAHHSHHALLSQRRSPMVAAAGRPSDNSEHATQRTSSAQ
jgi:hypothetical protein